MTGCWPTIVDHINGDKTDNRWRNLRVCTAAQNSQNAVKPVSNNSGVKGVCWHKGAKKWSAEFRHEGKRYYLGLYTKLEDAARVVKEERTATFGEFERRERI